MAPRNGTVSAPALTPEQRKAIAFEYASENNLELVADPNKALREMKAVWVKMAQDAGFSPASVWLSAKSNGEKPKKKEFTAKYKCTYQGKEYTWTGVGLQPKKELRLAMGLATLDDWAKLSATEKKEKLRPYLIQ